MSRAALNASGRASTPASHPVARGPRRRPPAPSRSPVAARPTAATVAAAASPGAAQNVLVPRTPPSTTAVLLVLVLHRSNSCKGRVGRGSSYHLGVLDSAGPAKPRRPGAAPAAPGGDRAPSEPAIQLPPRVLDGRHSPVAPGVSVVGGVEVRRARRPRRPGCGRQRAGNTDISGH